MSDQPKRWVVLSNELLNSSYKLSVTEQRVLALALEKVDSKKVGPQGHVEITSNEYKERYDSEGRNRHACRDIRAAIKNLFNREIYVDVMRDGRTEVKTRWVTEYYSEITKELGFQSMDQIESPRTPVEGVFEIQFSPRVLRHIKELRSNFTKFDSREYGKFKSSYSHRLYELLTSKEKQGVWRVDVDEFRALIGADGKYDLITQLLLRVVEPARDEIEDKTDLRFEIDKRRVSRKIKTLIFTITREPKGEAPE